MHRIRVEIEAPTLEQKIGAAIFVATFSPEHTGIRTLAQLMWPQKEFSDVEAKKEAASFLTDVHIALLKGVPQTRLDQLLKDQAERLSFVFG